MTITVLEVRKYLIKPTMQQHFIDYFEEHFITSQREVGMQVLGQFRPIGDPNHFVWIRGFEDMVARLKGLQGFYGGSFWAKHRNTTNSMILDNDDVLLLSPLTDIADLTCGATAERIAADLAAATISPATGVIVLERYQAKVGQRETVIEALQAKVLPLYERESISVRGLFVAEMSENTYPRLPVIQNADELVVITAYADEAAYYAQYDKLQTVIKDSLAGLLNRASDALLLSPTLRSPIRNQTK
jgi:hypothetical protein